MKIVKTSLWVGVGAAALMACGQHPKDKTAQGDPIHFIQGKLTESAEGTSIDISGDVRVAVIWTTQRSQIEGEPEALFEEVFFSQSARVTETRLPASFRLAFHDLPPESFMREWSDGEDGARYAIGFLIAYEDRDGNEEFTLPSTDTIELADKILHFSEHETLLVYVEGEAPAGSNRGVGWPFPPPPDALRDLPVEPFHPVFPVVDGVMLDSGRAGGSVLADQVEPGFNLLELSPAWAASELELAEHARCASRARYYELGEQAFLDCEAILDEGQGVEAERELEACLAGANGEQAAQEACTARYYAKVVEPYGSPKWERQAANVEVELPIRDEPQVGRSMCPPPEGNPPNRPTDFDLQRARCSGDGYSICVPPARPSQRPTYCYGTYYGAYAGQSLLSAAQKPSWWPCELGAEPAELDFTDSFFGDFLDECLDSAQP